jgi:hypothetical protein
MDYFRLPSRHFCLALYPKPAKRLHNLFFLAHEPLLRLRAGGRTGWLLGPCAQVVSSFLLFLLV